MADKRMNKLKPCPFCGQMPKVDTSQWKHFEHQRERFEVIERRVKITCKKCFLTMDIVATGYASCGLDEKTYRAFSKTLVKCVIDNVWNRRVADAER